MAEQRSSVFKAGRVTAMTVGFVLGLFALTACVSPSSEAPPNLEDVETDSSTVAVSPDAVEVKELSFLDSLENCGLDFSVEPIISDLATGVGELSQGTVAVLDDTYLVVDISTTWDSEGVSQISLACLFAELEITESFASAIAAEAEKQELNSKLVATGSQDFMANLSGLDQQLANYLSQASTNAAWNSERNKFLGVLQSTYSKSCSDPEKWPGDSYLCGNQRDFTSWIKNIGCRDKDYSPKKPYCGGTENWNEAWLLPLRPTFELEIDALESSIEDVRKSAADAEELENGGGVLFTRVNGELSQAWAFGQGGNLFLVLTSQR